MTDSADDRLLGFLRLSLINGIGPRILRALLDRFGSPEAVLTAGIGDLRNVSGVGAKLARSIVDERDQINAAEELQQCRSAGVSLILRGGDDYSKSLAEIYDPPNLLYCRGRFLPTDELAIAIVGSRRCTLYGRQQAERLAGELARAGMTVVSGLARGIDAVAHRGALAAGGRTIAVMATVNVRSANSRSPVCFHRSACSGG